jgi:outer membrane biosynthesis protein TonB
VENLETYKKKKGIINVKVKDGQQRGTGEMNVEIEWDEGNNGKVREEEEERKKKEKEKAEKEKAEKEKAEKEKAEKEKVENKKKEEGSEKKSRSIRPTASTSSMPLKEKEKEILRVRVIDGKFYEKQDIFGSGDPYVKISFNNETHKTKVYHNTKSATFNESM